MVRPRGYGRSQGAPAIGGYWVQTVGGMAVRCIRWAVGREQDMGEWWGERLSVLLISLPQKWKLGSKEVLICPHFPGLCGLVRGPSEPLRAGTGDWS